MARPCKGTPASSDIRVRESSRSSIVTSSARHGGESSPGGEEHCERRRVVMDDGPCAPICTPYAGGASKALGASSHGMWGRSTWKRSRRLRERVPSFALYSRQRTSCAHSQSVGYPWLPAFDSAECRSPVRSGVGCGDHMQPSVGGGTGLTIHHHFTSDGRETTRGRPGTRGSVPLYG